jgi:hypothetical protein
VAAVNVVGKLVKEVTLVWNALSAKVPEMVVRIADRYVRLQSRFLSQSQPVVASVWHESASLAVFGGQIISYMQLTDSHVC